MELNWKNKGDMYSLDGYCRHGDENMTGNWMFLVFFSYVNYPQKMDHLLLLVGQYLKRGNFPIDVSSTYSGISLVSWLWWKRKDSEGHFMWDVTHKDKKTSRLTLDKASNTEKTDSGPGTLCNIACYLGLCVDKYMQPFLFSLFRDCFKSSLWQTSRWRSTNVKPAS